MRRRAPSHRRQAAGGAGGEASELVDERLSAWPVRARAMGGCGDCLIGPLAGLQHAKSTNSGLEYAPEATRILHVPWSRCRP